MCAAVKIILSRKLSCSGTSYQVDQLESSCLIDAAIAFCKLQHLDPTISIKTQVCSNATFILGKVTELFFFFSNMQESYASLYYREKKGKTSHTKQPLPHLGDKRRLQQSIKLIT
jgi:hypothetical protein